MENSINLDVANCLVETTTFTKRVFTNVCTHETFDVPLSVLEFGGTLIASVMVAGMLIGLLSLGGFIVKDTFFR